MAIKKITSQRRRKPRCKFVATVLNNRLVRVRTIREEVHRIRSESELITTETTEYMVVEWPDHPEYPHITIPMTYCVFLMDDK